MILECDDDISRRQGELTTFAAQLVVDAPTIPKPGLSRQHPLDTHVFRATFEELQAAVTTTLIIGSFTIQIAKRHGEIGIKRIGRG